MTSDASDIQQHSSVCISVSVCILCQRDFCADLLDGAHGNTLKIFNTVLNFSLTGYCCQPKWGKRFWIWRIYGKEILKFANNNLPLFSVLLSLTICTICSDPLFAIFLSECIGAIIQCKCLVFQSLDISCLLINIFRKRLVQYMTCIKNNHDTWKLRTLCVFSLCSKLSIFHNALHFTYNT